MRLWRKSLDPTRVHTLASRVLDVAVEELAANGITVPKRQYVHSGEVAWDCEQLVVTIDRFGQPHDFPGSPVGLPNRIGRGASFTRSVDFSVWLVKKVCALPNDAGDPPSLKKLQDDGLSTSIEGWTLLASLQSRAYAGTLIEELCTDVGVGPCEAVGPEGGYFGWQCVVTVVL